MSVSTKKMISFRLSEDDMKLLEEIQKQLSSEYKVSFDRTKTIEYLIRWEYDRKYKSNSSKEYIDSLIK